jgi:hypothetical protein
MRRESRASSWQVVCCGGAGGEKRRRWEDERGGVPAPLPRSPPPYHLITCVTLATCSYLGRQYARGGGRR